MQFPIFKSKTNGLTRKFDLTDGKERERYFQAKAGPEIKKLRQYLKKNTFVAYLLGKKNSGKGTYAKMFQEIVAPDRVEHFSVGDMVRQFDEIVNDVKRKKDFTAFLEKNYRGRLNLLEILKSLEERSTKKLLPTELILVLVKREIAKRSRKAFFIDGFPRDMDQISYSLFFRDLIDYRQDPDVFVLIDVPEAVIDQRIKCRVICPLCQTSRSIRLLPTKSVGYDEKKEEFYLICDNSKCRGARMIGKEGDELGISPIKARLALDEELIKEAINLYGIPKIFLRNSVPVKVAGETVDDYEITPEFIFEKSKGAGKINVFEKPWKFLDDDGAESYSLMPPPVVVSLIKQLAEVLGL